MNIIPCISWVRRGIAQSVPDKVQLSRDELRKIIDETKEVLGKDDVGEWEDVDSSPSEAEEGAEEREGGATAARPRSMKNKLLKLGKRKKGSGENDQDEVTEDEVIIQKYGLDDYDDQDEDNENALHGVGKLAYYGSNEDDPYMTIKDDDSDNEDFEIKPSDNLIVVGRAQEDACMLEVYVYNEELCSLYVHHDIVLSSFPLTVEWLNYDLAEDKPGNFAAVGTMLPGIDIWDLDVVDSLEPVATLGEKLVKKKASKKKGSVGGHRDAVLDLSWNSILRNVLASASADVTVGVWDLSQGKIVTSLKQHTDKVQCVKWHPFEAQSLLSGSFDHTVKVYDCRDGGSSHKSWSLQGEIECLTWDHFSPFSCLASTDKGMVYGLDVRTDKPTYILSAHTQAVTGLTLSSHVKDLLVTTSTDRTLKVWDTKDSKPSMILEKDLKMSELHCVGCCPEAPYVFAIGGQNELKVWDIRESATVKKHFQDGSAGALGETRDTAVSMETLSLANSQTAQKQSKKKRKKKKKVQQKPK